MSIESQKSLYTTTDGAITRNDIEIALKNAGLQSRDVVMVHSDLGTFGKLGQITSREEFLNEILHAFLNVIGNEGTLIVPTYTYSFCKDEIFDVKFSKSSTGLFCEYVRKQKNAIRSNDPIFSHAGIGPAAKKLLRNVGNECFGKNSFFDRLYHENGKIVNFGKYFDITFLHYIESNYKVSYRYHKKFLGTIKIENGQPHIHEVDYYVRALPNEGLNVVYNMTTLGHELERLKLLKRVALGDSFVLCSCAQDCFTIGTKMLSQNEYAFLSHDPKMSN